MTTGTARVARWKACATSLAPPPPARITSGEVRAPVPRFHRVAEFSLGGIKLKLHVPAVDVAKLLHALEEGNHEAFPRIALFGVDELAGRNDKRNTMNLIGRSRPLRPQRGQKPATDQGDDNAPFHATFPQSGKYISSRVRWISNP
ncbi:hypothetical protein ACO2JO_15445 [Leptospira interrogans]